MTVRRECEGCGVAIEADDVDAFVDAYAAHVLETHADWGYTDRAVRSYVRRWFTSDVGGDGGT
jgi:hypothetical protein